MPPNIGVGAVQEAPEARKPVNSLAHTGIKALGCGALIYVRKS